MPSSDRCASTRAAARAVRPREVEDGAAHLEHAPAGASPRATDEADAAVVRLDLATGLARLTPRQRAVLVLRFYEDLSESATAAALGCSVNTVKSQTRHALHRLRALAPDVLTDDRDPEVAR